MTDEDDEAVRGWTGCAVVVVAVGVAAVGVFAGSIALPLLAVPVAATGSLVGAFARRTRPGRVAAACGLGAVLLCAGAVLLVYGSAMAGMGLAR